ncbi:MAG: 2-methylthioadenine synthetase, partial [Slackia piriformis]
MAEILDGCGRAFHVVNLGCKVNRVESDDFAARLLSQGASCVPLSEASLIIVNTCTVTGEAEKKTRKAVRQALRANDSARVVVTGCAAAIDPDTYASMSERVSVVPKGRLTSLFDEAVAASESLRVGAEFPTRVGVKVQDGCNNACAYC